MMVRRRSSRKMIMRHCSNEEMLQQLQMIEASTSETKNTNNKRTPYVSIRKSILDGMEKHKIRFDKQGHPIIAFPTKRTKRRSTKLSTCSDLTFDSEEFDFENLLDNEDDDEDDYNFDFEHVYGSQEGHQPQDNTTTAMKESNQHDTIPEEEPPVAAETAKPRRSRSTPQRARPIRMNKRSPLLRAATAPQAA